MRRLFLTVLICMLVLATGCTSVDMYSADKGRLDLTGKTFDDSTVYKMRGEWKIAWNRFLDPVKDREEIEDIDTYIDVPKTWSSLRLGDIEIGNQGFGTLALDVDTGKELDNLAVQSTYVTSAFEIYANGVLVASNGKIGENSADMNAVWHPVEGDIDSSDGEIQVVIHFSNFNHRRFAIKDFYTGSEEAVARHKNERLAVDLITFGGIFIMGLYHLMIYILRRRDRASLFFSILCFSYALRTILVGDRFIYEIFPNIPWELFMKLAYITFYVTSAFFVLFMQSTFSSFKHKFVKNLMAASVIIAVAATLLFPARIFDRLLVPFELVFLGCLVYLMFVIVKAMKFKEIGSNIMLIGFFLLIVAAINDMLYESFNVGIASMTPFALIIIIYAQSYILAKRFTMAYESAERLLEENMLINQALNEQNENLEETIRQRTFEIKEMNEELKASNEELVGLITAVNKSETHFRGLFENMPIGVFCYGSKRGFTMVNPSMAEIFGFEFPAELVGALNSKSYTMIEDSSQWDEFIVGLSKKETHRTKRQIQMVRKCGETITVEVTSQIVDCDDYEVLSEGTIMDISHRIAMENELNLLASTDALTGLYNRRTFSKQIERIKAGAHLAIIDIDNFKNINDTYGHDVGDLVLKKTAKTLTGVCGPDTFVARIGGEEFAVIFDPKYNQNVLNHAEDIRSAIEGAPFIHSGQTISYSVSIGMCSVAEGISTADIYKKADVALYRAKQNGKNRVIYFRVD